MGQCIRSASSSALVILDDVWESDHAQIFLLETAKSRLLITTRNNKFLSSLTIPEHDDVPEPSSINEIETEQRLEIPKPGRSSLIFISYRREDSAGYADRLYDQLSQHFGDDNVFMDIDTIEPGLDFVEIIEEAVGSCDVLIALIGRQWLTVTDDTGRRRLDNPEDFLRLEIKTALDRNISVIPVLIPGATMPRSQDLPDELKRLARRNAIMISERFHPDVNRLIEVIEKELERAPGSASVKPMPKRLLELYDRARDLFKGRPSISRQDDLQKLIASHNRDLQILREQKAMYGVHTAINIVSEIDNTEETIKKLQAELAELEIGQELTPQPKVAASPQVSPPAELDPQLASFRAQPRVFLCHASEDKPRVRELYHQLKTAGYSPWLDKFDLLPGQNWRREIEKIISDPYNIVVICLSCNSTTKRGVVQQEIKWVLDVLDQQPEDTIYLIPVRLEACEAPERLSELHWVNLFEPDGFEYLKRALDYEISRRQGGSVSEAPVTPPSSRQPEPVPPVKTSAPPQPKPKPTTRPKILTPQHPFEPELILIPAGEFLMGSDPKKDNYARDDEQPQHKLYLPDYYIAKTPMTNVQYEAFMEATGQRPPIHWQGKGVPSGKENYPVVNVSWKEAVAYCRWLAKITGKAYRLPTEAEWEKAARGLDGRIYPWGNKWEAKRCNTREGGKKGTTPVDYYPAGASPYGVLDMAGNVWEWTRTLWGKDVAKADFKYPYAANDGREAEAEDTIPRVVRGGSFYDRQYLARCACRVRFFPGDQIDYGGFRVVVSLSQ